MSGLKVGTLADLWMHFGLGRREAHSEPQSTQHFPAVLGATWTFHARVGPTNTQNSRNNTLCDGKVSLAAATEHSSALGHGVAEESKALGKKKTPVLFFHFVLRYMLEK